MSPREVRSRADKIAGALSLFAVVGAATTMATAIVFVIATLHTRRWGQVEAEMVFEALRVRSGFPLYFDPIAGAHEYGEPPTRYYVLYTAIWPTILSHLGPASLEGLRSAGRIFDSLLWIGFFMFVIRSAPKETLRQTHVACALACGGFFIARETTLACADTLATVLAGLALHRAVKKGGLDVLAGALLAAAPFVKPNVIGFVPGIYLFTLAGFRKRTTDERRRTMAGLLMFLLVTLAGFAICRHASGGMFPDHLFRATGQTLSFDRLVSEVSGRGLFLGLPHLIVLIALLLRRANPIAIAALASSLALSIFLMSKHGSGGHYFIEPTIAAAIGISETPFELAGGKRVVAWLAAAAFSITTASSTVAGFRGDVATSRERAADTRALADACALGPGEVAISTDLLHELALDGRVVIPHWQTSYLVRKGTFPLEVWRQDLSDPHVTCLIHGPEWNAPLPDKIQGIVEVGAFRKELREDVEKNFVFVRPVAGWLVFKRR